MKDYQPSTYGDRIADVYDEWYGELDPGTAVTTLAELAGGGPALELAIGTGRIALPLAATGLEVHGIDVSGQMVARLREKPGGGEVPVTIGDFADVGVAGAYRLVYVAFNTFFALLTQDDQVRCFENVAAHLTPDGVFVIEAFVPDVTRFDRGQRLSVEKIETESVTIHAARHDALTQQVSSHHLVLSEGVEPRFQPVRIRYAWPSELDLMARLAGLRLRDRWAGWEREEFTADSVQHVSVYARA
ncbi:MAG: class I SAM-dependent DNA methyltransferase [Gaiellaceae bacterium]